MASNTINIATIIAQTVTEPLKIRVQKSILLLHPCAKLWYLCRALDSQSRGFIALHASDWQALGSKVTLYRWLREGRSLGFFRFSRWRKDGTLEICLGGLLNICKKSSIKNWGATADEILLSELLDGNNRRRIASAIATQDLQARSYFAAKQQLSTLDKKTFKVPLATELLDSQTSSKMARGGTTGIIHIGEERIFVGKSFVPFGVSQALVCEVLNSEPHSCGVSDRTLRRHLDHLGINKRQLIQAKPEYDEIRQRLNQGTINWECATSSNIRISPTERGGIIRLHEPNGRSGARQEGGRLIDVKQLSPRYYGATWLYRCNLYGLSYTLTSMKFKRWEWKQSQVMATTVAITPCELQTAISPLDPPLEESMPTPALEGGVGDQNKADKNDNGSNVEPETVLDISTEKPPSWEEMKEKLLRQKQERGQAKRERLVTGNVEPVREHWKPVVNPADEAMRSYWEQVLGPKGGSV